MKKYLITSKEFYTDSSIEFPTILHKQLLKYSPSMALYRDKENPEYKNLALAFVKVCREFDAIDVYIHRDANLAKELNATGVHLTSTQFNEIEYAKSLGLKVIISTHTYEDVLRAEVLGADAVTYSPIFASPDKGKPKGIEDLKELLELCTIDVIALGGIISDEQIEQLEATKVKGFASIRYFY